MNHSLLAIVEMAVDRIACVQSIGPTLFRIACSDVFASARRTAYVVVYAMLVAALLLPIHYACGASAPCLGCGFRESVALALQMRFAEAVASSALIVPAAVFTGLSLVDVTVMVLVRGKGGRARPHAVI